MRWTDSDNLRARDALVVGGPLDGLIVAVSDSPKGLRYPDVIDLTHYRLDTHEWILVWNVEPTDV